MSTPIPKPKGLPILGNLFNLDGNNPWASFNKLALTNKDFRPIFKISILGHDIVFVTGAALLEEICDEKRFRKCVAGPIIEIRAAVHDSLFTAKHDEMEMWGIAHRIMAPLATPEATALLYSGIRETSADLIKKWTAGPRQRVHITNDLDRLNHEANTLCFFDKRVHCMEGPEPALVAAMADSTGESLKRPTRPRLLTWLLHERKWKRDIKTMRDFGASLVQHRRDNPSDKKDMLHALMHGTDPETGRSLTESQVLDEIINVYIGSATAPNLVAFALYYLMKNPDEIRKAQDELDTVVGPTADLEHTHLTNLPYVEAILREAFRLSGVAPGFNIEPIPEEGNDAPVMLAGGEYQVPRNQPLIAILAAVNRDPAVFDDPDAFKPERMVGEKFDALPAGVKKGFGNGQRRCFGSRYAWEWSFFTLAAILKDVDFQQADPSYVMHNEGVNYSGAFTVKPVGFFGITGPRVRQ
ncbi:putative cytochrome P450 [Aspergillus candidus]|uniref:Cytochrome P450 n=1 Tax=Aspergillus candidus TaxID=41067 RepID=A0A2I2FNS3_ASPCN|nr:cytochrome P450 [Aspergillus candidus]PLB42272.1 cytochrome P450 [Aspergillus candidus]